MRLTFDIFKGEIPIIPVRSLPVEHAQTANNADLSQGLLKSFYKPSATKTLNTTAWRTIFPVKSGGVTFWFCSAQYANAENAPVYNSGARFYYSDGVRSKQSNYTLASNAGDGTYGTPNSEYYLGVTKPDAALTLTLRGTSDGIVVDSVSYVYTFITDWGEEGEPSDPTAVTDIDGGEYVELGNFEIPVPTGYNIVGIRIYRTSTGSTSTEFQFVSEAMTGASTDYVTPAEITANSSVWDDKDSGDEMTDAADLSDVLATTKYIEPPSAIKGLIALSNGCFAAFRGREIYVSEPFIPYGYPDDYIVETSSDVVAIGAYGTTVVVGTGETPYRIDGLDPQQISMVKLPDKQACLYERGMVSGKGFCLYPSQDGLFMVSDESTGLVTDKMFTKEQWRALLTTSTAYDKTIVAFLYDGKYYAFFEGSASGFIIDFNSDKQFYTTFTLPSGYLVYGGYVDASDDSLYLLVKIDTIYYIKKWEGDTTDNLIYKWKSKIFVTPYSFFSCAKLNGNFATDSTGTGTISSSGTAVTGVGTTFTTELEVGNVIYNETLNEYREVAAITSTVLLTLVSAFTSNVSGKAFKYNSETLNVYKDNSLFFTRAVNSDEPFRLPAGKGREWEVELKGDKQVYEMRVAQSMRELR